MGAFGVGSAIIAAILWFLRKRGEEQQTYLCKKDRNGFAYMRHNILVVAVALLGLAVSIFLVVIGGIYILPNKPMTTLLLPAIPIILGVLIASAASLITKVKLTDNELIYGVFKRKHILLSDLQKAAITNPPCVYRKNKRP